MTIIAGWHDAKEAWIGGDSGAFADETVTLTETKVWKTEDEYLIGASGGFRMAEVAYESEIGDPTKLRNHLEAWWKEMDCPENDTSFLIISTAGIWTIGPDFSIVRSKEHYGATGAGEVAALSALYALNNVSMKGKERITVALKAVAYHTTSARAPFKIISL